ncbi:hypothetical protein GCM10010208_62060 [Actinomadura livida]|nr:hypothetical protein GCM10010208_62060 [Actinomadura livida]
MHIPLAQQVGDAVGEDPGLARSGARDDQQRAAGVHDGGALLLIEAVEQGVCFGLRHHVRVYGAAATFSARPARPGGPRRVPGGRRTAACGQTPSPSDHPA